MSVTCAADDHPRQIQQITFDDLLEQVGATFADDLAQSPFRHDACVCVALQQQSGHRVGVRVFPAVHEQRLEDVAKLEVGLEPDELSDEVKVVLVHHEVQRSLKGDVVQREHHVLQGQQRLAPGQQGHGHRQPPAAAPGQPRPQTAPSSRAWSAGHRQPPAAAPGTRGVKQLLRVWVVHR